MLCPSETLGDAAPSGTQRNQLQTGAREAWRFSFCCLIFICCWCKKQVKTNLNHNTCLDAVDPSKQFANSLCQFLQSNSRAFCIGNFASCLARAISRDFFSAIFEAWTRHSRPAPSCWTFCISFSKSGISALLASSRSFALSKLFLAASSCSSASALIWVAWVTSAHAYSYALRWSSLAFLTRASSAYAWRIRRIPISLSCRCFLLELSLAMWLDKTKGGPNWLGR